MIVVKRLTVDGILRVVHPYLTNGRQFKQTEGKHRVIVALIAQVLEVHLPRGILYLTLLIRRVLFTFPVLVIITCHIVVTMITID